MEKKDVIHSKECNKECNVSMLRTFAWSYGVSVLPPHEGMVLERVLCAIPNWVIGNGNR